MSRPEQEVDRNYDAFVARLPEFLRDHDREYVLLRDTEAVGSYVGATEALAAGRARFGDGPDRPGATRTRLTRQLIRRLHLPPRQRMLVASATACPERRMAYGFSFGLYHGDGPLPGLFVFEGERVAPDFYDNESFDVLLGMNILSTGRLIFEPDHSFRFEF